MAARVSMCLQQTRHDRNRSTRGIYKASLVRSFPQSSEEKSESFVIYQTRLFGYIRAYYLSDFSFLQSWEEKATLMVFF